MSKKTRKKSSKTPARRTAKAPWRLDSIGQGACGQSPQGGRKKSAKASRSSIRSPKAASRKWLPNSASPKASHKAASKPLKSAASAATKSTRSVLVEGAQAPAFQLPRDGGGSVSLADYAGKKLVLFFYPRADTPGCTREAIDFTRLKDAFAASGTAGAGRLGRHRQGAGSPSGTSISWPFL